MALVLVFSIQVTAFAVSPNGTPTEDEPGESSPKTGDMDILMIGLAGGACAVTAFAAAKKAKKEA